MTAETTVSDCTTYFALRGGAFGDKGSERGVTCGTSNSSIEKLDCAFGLRIVLYLI